MDTAQRLTLAVRALVTKSAFSPSLRSPNATANNTACLLVRRGLRIHRGRPFLG